MLTLSEFNNGIERLDTSSNNGYKRLFVHQVRAELLKDDPMKVYLGTDMFFWLSSIDMSGESYGGSIRVFTDNLDRYVDVCLVKAND